MDSDPVDDNLANLRILVEEIRSAMNEDRGDEKAHFEHVVTQLSRLGDEMASFNRIQNPRPSVVSRDNPGSR